MKNNQGDVAQSVEDPVCGMEVDPGETEYSIEHEGVLYFFCGEACMNEFRKEHDMAWD